MITPVASLNSQETPETRNLGFPKLKLAKAFIPKKLQEPKRHNSEIILRDEKGEGSVGSADGNCQPPEHLASFKTASQYYQSHMPRVSGVSTPPPPGYQYGPYTQPYAPAFPQPHMQDPNYAFDRPSFPHYSTNSLPQGFAQGYYGMPLGDTGPQYSPIPSMQYMGPSGGYYPMYSELTQHQNIAPYPIMPPGIPHPSKVPQSAKKKSPMKPSQFKPQPSPFTPFTHDYGEHNAENEELVIAIIKEFEEKNGDEEALVGKIASLAVTQTGSRFLQKQLISATPDFVTFVLREV